MQPSAPQPIGPTPQETPLQPTGAMPQESPTQPAEQTIQSDFPAPIAMATQSPQTQVTPITNAQANQAINKIDAAEKDKKVSEKPLFSHQLSLLRF